VLLWQEIGNISSQLPGATNILPKVIMLHKKSRKKDDKYYIETKLISPFVLF